MKWVKGVSGNPSGRPKMLLERADQVLHRVGKIPVIEILKLIESGEISKTTQAKIWLELMEYVYLKPKGFAEEEVDQVRRELEAMSKADLIKRLEADLESLKAS